MGLVDCNCIDLYGSRKHFREFHTNQTIVWENKSQCIQSHKSKDMQLITQAMNS